MFRSPLLDPSPLRARVGLRWSFYALRRPIRTPRARGHVFKHRSVN